MDGISQGLWKALGYLFVSGIAFVIFWLGKDYAQKTQDIKWMMLKGVMGIIFVAFIGNSLLGTHSENCEGDYMSSNCDMLQDYKPTSKQYTTNFTYYLVFMTVPYLLGINEGYKNNKNKRVQ